MGYYSEYYVMTDGTEMEEMALLATLRRDTDAKYVIDKHGNSSGELASWDEWEDDVIEMSQRFRGLAILVHRKGITDPDDEEYAYFLSGEVTKPKEVHFFSPSWEVWLKQKGRK